MLKVGDKILLDLNTHHGSVGCYWEDHLKVFIIIDIYLDSVTIKLPDKNWWYNVYPEMCKPFCRQLLFDFMLE